MAVSAVNQIQFNSNSNNQTSFATASWTPTANRLVILTYQTTNSSSNARTFTAAGNGITWSPVSSFKWFDTGAGTRYWIATFIGLTGASPSAGATTVTNSASTNGGLIIIDELSGVDISGTALQAIVQQQNGPTHTTNGTDISQTITLGSAITGSNASYGCLTHNLSSGTTTEGSGYTPLGNAGVSTPGRIITEIKGAGSTTVDFSWSAAGRGSGVALEIKEAVVPPELTIDTDLIKVAAALNVSEASANIVTTIENILAAIAAKQEYDLHIAATIKKVTANIQLSETVVSDNDVWVETWVNDNDVWVPTWE